MTELEAKLKSQVAKSTNASTTQGKNLKELLNAPATKKKFDELLQKRAPQFISSILNLSNSDAMLQKAEPMSVITSCIVAATLDLPIDKNLGYAWIVPYAGKAQFQMGYKGYIQLALRTGQYKALNVTEIHEGELKQWNPLTEELKLDIDFENRQSDAVIGYAGYFELVNGFRKTVYWSREQIEIHKRKFSKSDFGWKKDYHAMAKKTVLRNLLSKWGILSIEMQKAVQAEIEPPADKLEDLEDTIDLSASDYQVVSEQADGVGEPESPQNEMEFE